MFHTTLSCPLIHNICSLINIISKLSSVAASPSGPRSGNEPTSPSFAPTTKSQHNPVPPSLSTTALAVPGSLDQGSAGLSEQQLKRQGLECLVAVLKSLVVWGTASTGPAVPESTESGLRSQNAEDVRQEAVTPGPSSDRLTQPDSARQQTPEVVDDPGKFESAKQKKTTLLEGIKKFNFKPKRVSRMLNLNDSFFTVVSGYRIFPGDRVYPYQVSERYRKILAGNRWAQQNHDWRLSGRRVSLPNPLVIIVI